MRFKATVILSTVLILLGGYLLIIELPREEKLKAAKQASERLFSFTNLEITRIRIESRKGTFELEYFPEHPESPWRIFTPVPTIADQETASRLAALLENLRSNRLIEENPDNLIDFGLDPPAFTVIVTYNQTNTEVIEVGIENLTGSDVYVRQGLGTAVYLVPAGIKSFLNKDLNAWRQKEVFPAASYDIKKIQIQSSRGRIQVMRQGEDWTFQIEPPAGSDRKTISGRGDAGEISNLLGSLINLRGDGFIDKQKAAVKQNLGTPILSLKLGVSKVERDSAFYRTENDPGVVYVVTKDFAPIYQISEKSFQAIDQAFSVFRNKRLLSLATPEEIEEIEISRQGKQLHLKKREGSWWMETPTSRKVETPETISRLLTDLYYLQAEAFLDETDLKSPGTGLSRPGISIQIKGKGGHSLGKVDFGKIEGGKIHARSSHHASVLLVDKRELDRLPEETELFPPPAAASGDAS